MIDTDGIRSEVAVGVTYSALMSAVALFFTGILISQYESFNQTIKVPLIFLIISTFSFIFAATIFNNAGTEITLNKIKFAEKYMVYAKNIMELLGLYLFILATPLVIGAVTEDNFLRYVTIIVAVTGFTLYSRSRFSVIQKELPVGSQRLLSGVIVLLTLFLYYFQASTRKEALFSYSVTAILLLLVLVTAVIQFCSRSKQYKPTSFRPYVDDDAEVLSTIILKNLKNLKGRRAATSLASTIKEQATPAAIRKLAKQQSVYVAEFNNHVVGLAALDGSQLTWVFTDPGLQRKGIGRMLIEYVEQAATDQGYDTITHFAGSVEHAFYVKNGYVEVEKSDEGTLMRKSLR
jgi:GNAT superfamily N-acetyltransferase